MHMLNTGGAMANAPADVCKVPTPAGPVPTPFPNIATTQMTNPASLVQKVLVVNLPALNQMSKIVLSNGDQAGTLGGVVSNKIMGQAQFLNGSLKVMVGGKPAVRVGCMTGQNGQPQNTVGSVLTPGQVSVMVMG